MKSSLLGGEGKGRGNEQFYHYIGHLDQLHKYNKMKEFHKKIDK